MAKKSLTVTPDEVPITALTAQGMTLSSDDRQFIKRNFDLHGEKVAKYVEKQIDKQFDRIAAQLSEALVARDQIMFAKMDDQTKLMLSFKLELKQLREDMERNHNNVDKRLRKIEARSSITAIIVRLVVTTAISIGGAVLVIKYLHDHFWNGLLSFLGN
jgi:hypothetical protein